MSSVFPGVAEVIANFLRPVSILMSELFPTLLLPMKAYSGFPSVGGQRSARADEMTNSAVLISMGDQISW